METNWCKLTIDENQMWARLSINAPSSDDYIAPNAEFIENFLKQAGITYGLNKAAIESLAHEVFFDLPVEVASGKKAVDGDNGNFSFSVNTEDMRAKPIVNKDGSVDYFNSLKLATVAKGEVFAKYVHATSGEYGYNIFSKLLMPKKGSEVPPLKGTGFTYDEETESYISEFDGHIVFKDNRITIEPLYRVNGDLDIETGNIIFNGDVEVTGDVRSGLSIETDGNIYIHGHVGSCLLNAGGDITIQKGTQGRGKCIIKAGRNITCKFVERCQLIAACNVYADSILDSNVYAGGQVIVNSKHGMIIGGTTHGVGGLNVKEAGNNTGTITHLNCGITPEDYDRYVELQGKLKNYSMKMSQINQHMERFNNIPADKLSAELNNTKNKILKAKISLSTQILTIKKELEPLINDVKLSHSTANIHVTGVSHIGVKVTICNNTYAVTEEFKDVVYSLNEKGKVSVNGYDSSD